MNQYESGIIPKKYRWSKCNQCVSGLSDQRYRVSGRQSPILTTPPASLRLAIQQAPSSLLSASNRPNYAGDQSADGLIQSSDNSFVMIELMIPPAQLLAQEPSHTMKTATLFVSLSAILDVYRPGIGPISDLA